MSTYHPDKWIIVKISSHMGETHHRVFACWYGGYTGGDSWKLNSGIVSVKREGEFIKFIGDSGSAYICHVDEYGTSGYGQGVLDAMIKSQNEVYDVQITPLSEIEAKEYVRNLISSI